MTIARTAAETFVTEAGGRSAEVLSAAVIVNMAGNLLVNMRRWNWLKVRASKFLFVDDQEYVALPSDYGEAVALILSDTVGWGAQWVSFDELIQLRLGPVQDRSGYKLAVTSTQDAEASPPISHQVEVWPTPTANSDSSDPPGYLVYRTAWVATGTNLVLPAFCEPLFWLVLQQTIHGMQEEDNAGLDVRVEQIRRSAVYKNAARKDGRDQPNRGGLRPGYTRYVEFPVPTVATP